MKLSKLFWLLLTCYLLTGCVTQEKCAERFPPQVITKDTTITVIRDTVIRDTVYIGGELLIWHDSIPCPELKYSKSVTSKGLTSTVTIAKGKLTAECKSDSLENVIEINNRIIETYREKANTEIKEKIVYREYWHDPFCHYWTLFSICSIIIYAAIRIIAKIYTGK